MERAIILPFIIDKGRKFAQKAEKKEKKMKKILGTMLVTLFLFLLTACGETTTTTTANATDSTTTTTTTAAEVHDPVTISYAAWNLGAIDNTSNLERLMIEAFMDQYPWITVEIRERPKVPTPEGTGEVDQNWNEFLGANAARGTLPDVYFTDSVETTIMNNWSLDVSSLAKADPEFMNISSDLRSAAEFGGKLMAIPYAVYYFGYFINTTLFDEQNGDVPVFEDTWTEFSTKVADIASQNVTNGTGVAGICGVDRLLEWYPSQLNPDLGWYTYDGSILHLDGAEFETTLGLYQNLMADKTLVYDALTADEKMAAFGTTGTWETGQLAAYWEYTPIIGSMLDLGYDVDFIGTPGTAAAHTIPVVLDLMCLSSQTEHPEEAYLLAKWMSFGKAGYLKRIEISSTVEGVTALNMTPLQPDTELLDAFFGIYTTFTEFRKVVEYDDYIIEPNKYVPGYIKARWDGVFNATTTLGQVFDQVRTGEMNYADVKTVWNTKANDYLSAARAAVFETLGVN
jgi:multiple sugar transport system substrate-binding protein